MTSERAEVTPSAADRDIPVHSLVPRLVLSLLLAVALTALLALYADVRSLRAALSSFEWRWMLPVVALTFLNLGLRFVKWEYYLRLLHVDGLRRSDSVAIFLANYLLILTPGKAGALLKSYFLLRTNGVPVARTMPVVLAERLTDGLGMVLVTAVAMFAYPAAFPAVAVVVAAIAAVLVVAQNRPLAFRFIDLAGRFQKTKQFAASFHTLYDSAHELLRPRPLLVATILGTVARAMEGVALYFVILGIGVPASLERFADALFITALSNIVGVLVMMPGGLGGTEASMAGLIGRFMTLPPAPATAATLLARAASFWLPALLGAAALVAKRTLFFSMEPSGDGTSPRADL